MHEGSAAGQGALGNLTTLHMAKAVPAVKLRAVSHGVQGHWKMEGSHLYIPKAREGEGC